MRSYETMFIVKPGLTPEEADKVAEEVSALISSNGEVISLDKWGKRKFAYEIEHLTEGYYYVIQFNAQGSFIAELERRLKLNDNVLRHLVVRNDTN